MKIKRLLFIAAFSVLCLISLSACCLSHSWSNPTCTEAPFCLKCGKVQKNGVALGHSWAKATCSAPETCTVCKETQGEMKPHTMKEATCTKPETCSVCGVTQGNALGHAYKQATCTTARTCIACGDTTGTPLGHDYQKNICRNCGDKLINDYAELKTYLGRNFNVIHTAIGDIDGFKYTIDYEDPNYWTPYDFRIVIGGNSSLWIDELDRGLGRLTIDADFLPYEDRIQAVVDVLDFQKSIIDVAEAAFPGKKIEVLFYSGGYEYASIKVGWVSESIFVWRNYAPYGDFIGDYSSTYLCDWYVAYEGDFFPYTNGFDDWYASIQVLRDVIDACPQYNLNFYLPD